MEFLIISPGFLNSECSRTVLKGSTVISEYLFDGYTSIEITVTFGKATFNVESMPAIKLDPVPPDTEPNIIIA